MNHLELVVHFVCLLCVLAGDTAVPDRGNSRSETPLSDSSGSGSGDGVVVDILYSDSTDEVGQNYDHMMNIKDNIRVSTSDVSSHEFLDIVTYPNEIRVKEQPAATDLTIVYSDCADEYREKIDHTMCLNDDVRVVTSGVSSHDILDIVNYHNEVRASVQPPATDMTKVVWDDLLATVAEKWAKQCHVDHDKNRDIPKYGLDIGQNVAGGYESWKDAMQAWFDEVELYRYGEDPDDYLGIGGWTKIGHYTQMVLNTTSRLGCGYAECRNTVYYRFYVCNYATGQSSVEFPYTQGERCSKCPHACSSGLCDCGGKLCLNGGRLDISSCSCSCQALYKGDNCSEEITTSFVSKSNCTYIGERPSVADCKGYGDRGMDTEFCQSHGGQFTCGDCDRYTNVKTEYCPVMCAICPEVCGGKQCLNRGRLNPDTCQCKCDQPFGGDTCDILTCPEKDKWHCAFFNSEDCIYSNVPIDCPYLCDICD